MDTENIDIFRSVKPEFLEVKVKKLVIKYENNPEYLCGMLHEFKVQIACSLQLNPHRLDSKISVQGKKFHRIQIIQHTITTYCKLFCLNDLLLYIV